MSDQTVEDRVSARRMKRLTQAQPRPFHSPNPTADVARLCQCFTAMCQAMPPALQSRAFQVLAEEMSDLLNDFCFDLSQVKHKARFDTAMQGSDWQVAVKAGFAPFNEMKRLCKQFDVGRP
ncbi:MAG TPA: hypothetical protein VIM11_04800 [Tepidisphaeraceae bacterium]